LPQFGWNFCSAASEAPVNPRHRILIVAIIVFAASLACSGLETAPPDEPTSPPVATAAPVPGNGPAQPGGLESVAVAAVIDGDTIELTDGRRVRYIGINTPERNQPYYAEATDTNRQLIGGNQIQLEFDVETFDQYGRTLAYVWANGQLVNFELVQRGFANAFTVPPNVRYETDFRSAEQAARDAGRGLWAGSDVSLKIVFIEANAPGSDRENPNGEWVKVANQGQSPVNMQGFTLKDEANHIYEFGNFSVPPGASFQLFSGQGNDNSTELYWGLVNDSVWNNDSDTAFLRDVDGALIDSFSY
jgi:micrococcal nuclease